MPNWTTNTVTVRGDKMQLECFKDALRGDNGVVDFNRIEPMPRELEITSGSQTNFGLACFSRKRFDSYRKLPWFQEEYPGVSGPKQLRELLAVKEPQIVEMGRQAAANIRKHGVPTWYEWCNRYWGTKWNACQAEVDSSDERLEYTFDTAWDAPRPLVEPIVGLAHSFELTIVWSADHEDGGPEEIYDDDHLTAARPEAA